ncbi:CoA transferase [SAR202 cluster bacterium AC-647-N09_OGT_505m]|nr:CoA transferase [SAR202 cluster bacterium AC-647-N09_OGT_505m]
MVEHSEAQPLSDLRVIDLTHGIAGPYCTKLLADFGADVIKVERPGTGDYARRMGPFPGDLSHPEKSGLFLFLNTNKRGITLDLKTTEGVETLKELVKGADILVESFKPEVMARLGLDYDSLTKINPDLIMTSVSNFGQTGPYRDYRLSELVLFATGGKMNSSGLPDRHPLKLGGNHGFYQAGNTAAVATLFAWYGREHQGLGGQHVDVSIFETQLGSINGRTGSLVQYQYTGDKGQRLGPIRGGYPSGVYPCADGYISVSGGGARWPRVADTMGRPDLVDSYYGTTMGQLDLDAREEFETTIWLPWILERTMEEVVAEGQANEMLIGPILTIDQAVDNHQQLAFRNYFVEIDHPVAGEFRYPGAPIFNNNGWWNIHRPAPMLGQHNSEVLEDELRISGMSGSAGLEGSSLAELRTEVGVDSASIEQSGERNKLPLEGIRIVDMTVIFAGPYGTMFLGDNGAEVIRVETLQRIPPGRGQYAHPDPDAEKKRARSTFPDRDPGERPWNRSSGFNQHARNKHSMSLDLLSPKGLETFRKLVEVSDVFIENNASGSMAGLGVDYSVVSQWNPRLIMISVCGYGQTGPWTHYRGIGSQFEAGIGHYSVMGYPDMDSEGVPASVATDACSGVTIAIAAIMALRQREKTGNGMYIDISLAENFLPHLGELFMDYTINGRVASSPGNRDHMGLMVQGVYPCAGDDEWIAISLGKIEQWHTLCRLMEKQELVEDERFGDMVGLLANHNQVDQIIGAWTTTQDPIDLFHTLQIGGISAGHVMHEEHAFNDPHIKERGFFVSVTAPEVGTHLYPGTTYKMSKIPFEVRKPPVRVGEDNDYIYREVLNLSEEEYDELKALGHIGMDYAPHVK